MEMEDNVLVMSSARMHEYDAAQAGREREIG